MIGTVKFIARERAFGFVHSADGTETYLGRDALANLPDLRVGHRIEYEIGSQRDGRSRAVYVREIA